MGEFVFKRKDGKPLTKEDIEEGMKAFGEYLKACEAAGMKLVDDD